MSGFISQIAGGLLGSGLTPGELPALLREMMSPDLPENEPAGKAAPSPSPSGGLPMLLQNFRNAGLGTHVDSWIGTGENLPLTGEHVLQALPSAQLDAWGARVGMNHQQLAGVLAQVLPHAVDHATPDGVLPPEDKQIPDLTSLIGRMFSK